MPASRSLAVRRLLIPGSSILSTPCNVCIDRHNLNTPYSHTDRERYISATRRCTSLSCQSAARSFNAPVGHSVHNLLSVNLCRLTTIRVTVLYWPLSNPVPWQNWMAAYLGYSLRMKTLFRGWPVMVHDTHTRRRGLTKQTKHRGHLRTKTTRLTVIKNIWKVLFCLTRMQTCATSGDKKSRGNKPTQSAGQWPLKQHVWLTSLRSHQHLN